MYLCVFECISIYYLFCFYYGKNITEICLLWMIRYISLLTNIFTQWILIDA